MNRATVLVLLGGLALTAAFVVAPKPPASHAGPFTPRGEDEVLEHVAKGAPRASTEPLTASEAAVQAQALIESARKNGGDPRLLGRAQAVLAPWWTVEAPPPEVRILRATLKQSFHDFEGALVDLDAMVAADPHDVQALLTRATVLFVQARYDEADAACSQLHGQVDDLVEALCAAPIRGVRGDGKGAVFGLQLLEVGYGNRIPPARRAWLASVQGELELWSGETKAAEASLLRALKFDPEDSYSRLLLAELRIDQGRWPEAIEVFSGRTMNDGELLMHVLALKGAAAPEYAARREELDARVAANRQRGETLHRREESRYALRLEGDVGKALALAKANWAVQKEPADARVLLEAAVAAKDSASAAPVREWMTKSGFADPRWVALLRALP